MTALFTFRTTVPLIELRFEIAAQLQRDGFCPDLVVRMLSIEPRHAPGHANWMVGPIAHPYIGPTRLDALRRAINVVQSRFDVAWEMPELPRRGTRLASAENSRPESDLATA